MMYGPSILPRPLKVWASNVNYTNGALIGSPTKAAPPNGSYAEGYEAAVANITSQYANYVQNALTQHSIATRDAMLLPGPDGDPALLNGQLYDNGSERFYSHSDGTNIAINVLEMSEQYRARTYSTGNNVNTSLRIERNYPGSAAGVDVETIVTTNGPIDTGILSYDTGGGTGADIKLAYDNYTRRLFVFGAGSTSVGSRSWDTSLASMSEIASGFDILSGGPAYFRTDRYCAAKGILLRAYRSDLGLYVVFSSSAGVSVDSVISLFTGSPGVANRPDLDVYAPVYLDYVPGNGNGAGRFVLVTRGGFIYTSTNGSDWITQKLQGDLIYRAGYTTRGLTSAAVIDDTFVYLVWDVRDNGALVAARSPAILISDDYFTTWRTYGTKYNYLRQCGQRIFYTVSPLDGYYDSYHTPKSFANCQWGRSQRLIDVPSLSTLHSQQAPSAAWPVWP